MSDAAWTALPAILVALGVLLVNLVVSVTALIKAFQTGSKVDDNTKKTEEVHVLVNSQRAVLEAEIVLLKQRLASAEALMAIQAKLHQAETRAAETLHTAEGAAAASEPPRQGV